DVTVPARHGILQPNVYHVGGAPPFCTSNAVSRFLGSVAGAQSVSPVAAPGNAVALMVAPVQESLPLSIPGGSSPCVSPLQATKTGIASIHRLFEVMALGPVQGRGQRGLGDLWRDRRCQHVGIIGELVVPGGDRRAAWGTSAARLLLESFGQ